MVHRLRDSRIGFRGGSERSKDWTLPIGPFPVECPTSVWGLRFSAWKLAGAKVVDLYCGAGGLTYGLERAGLDVVAGVDVDELCRYPYETNTKAEFVARDVRDYGKEDLASAWDGAEIRILVGCAPCQPFSTYVRGSRPRKQGRRWELIEHFAALVELTRPDIVSMENLPPLARTDAFHSFVRRLEDVGYEAENPIVDCRHYGAPQTRRRLLLLASKHGRADFSPATHHDPDTWRDVASTIGRLPTLEAGEVDSQGPLHRSSRLSDRNLARIRASKPGGTWRAWPQALVSPCHRRQSGKSYPAIYGRMEWDRPAPTITGQCFGYGNGRFGHPEQDRAFATSWNGDLRRLAAVRGHASGTRHRSLVELSLCLFLSPRLSATATVDHVGPSVAPTMRSCVASAGTGLPAGNHVPTPHPRSRHSRARTPTMNQPDLVARICDRPPAYAWFLGAGASRAAGLPTATDIIWDLKRRQYCREENQGH